MMQVLHHRQQKLATLLSVAPHKVSSSSSATASASASDDCDVSRIGAITALHRAILYPPNYLLISHSAFLAQRFSLLLSDKLYGVRQAAATAFGALCSMVCSIPIASNGRQSQLLLGSLVDRFISWALPLLSNVSAGDGSTDLALESLHEFLNISY